MLLKKILFKLMSLYGPVCRSHWTCIRQTDASTCNDAHELHRAPGGRRRLMVPRMEVVV